MRELAQYRAVMFHLPEGCKDAEVEAEKQKVLSVEIVGGIPDIMGFSEQTELFVRASGERTGMVYTQKLDEEPQQVIRQALRNSEAAQSKEAEPMCTPKIWQMLKESMANTGCISKDFVLTKEEEIRELSVKELFDYAKWLCRELEKACGMGDCVRVCLSQTISTMGVVNSWGMDVTASTERFVVGVRTDSGYSGYLSALCLEEINAEFFIREMHRQQKELPIVPSKAGTYRAVLASSVVNNILITAWQMFTGNRAQNGSTPLYGKEGQQIFSSCVTIRDYKGGRDSANPIICGFSWQIDCEGVPSQDLTLVEHGVLKGWMHNLSTASAAGVISTGNAGRKTLLSGNIHTDMQIMPKNFTMESGEAELEELIAACGDGVYIFENYDPFHALNVVSGDFSFPCKGIQIRNGKMVGIMEGLTMSGNVCSLFSHVEIMGKDRVINPLVMYDSYEVSGPAMLVSELKIGG
ncbi:MAG: TldD/PmbA family protein [Lachnospiraceae bacterium]